MLLGLLADQHGGPRLARCRSSDMTAPPRPRRPCLPCAIIASLHTAICYRIGLGRWRIEAGEEIPTHENGQPRPPAAIMRDVNRAFEVAVRRDPANWFWVHRRWKAVEDRKIADGTREKPAPCTLPPTSGRILVRGTNWLGDAVMTTPALLRLREKFPARTLALLTPEKLGDLWLHHPAVDEVISFTPDESVLSTGKKLRAGKFEVGAGAAELSALGH